MVETAWGSQTFIPQDGRDQEKVSPDRIKGCCHMTDSAEIERNLKRKREQRGESLRPKHPIARRALVHRRLPPMPRLVKRLEELPMLLRLNNSCP